MTKHKPTTAPAEEALVSPEVEELRVQLAESDNKWRRALADYQNLEKRTSDQRSMYLKLANISLIEKLLSALDDLEKASAHLQDKGLEMIVGRLSSVLKEEGLTEIAVDQGVFDPTTMECLEVVAGQKDQVIRVVQKGYRLYDTVLRPAKVEVGSGIVNINHQSSVINHDDNKE